MSRFPTTDFDTFGNTNDSSQDTESLNVFNIPSIEWLLRDEKDNPVSNFFPQVLGEVSVHTSHGIETYVSLGLYFKDGNPSKTFMIPLTDIDKINWLSKDKRCIINSPQRKSKEYIANLIVAGLTNIPNKEDVYRLDRMGIHNINGSTIYVAGDRVIARSSDKDSLPKIEIAPLGFKLDIDPKLTPGETFKGMRELIRLSPEMGRPLVAHSISGIMRSAFITAGATPSSILEIIGGSGSFKTFYTPTITQLYNRAEEIKVTARLNASDRFIEDILYNYCECTAVIDDRCTAASSKIKRKNDDTAEEIMRRVGDNIGRGRMDGKTKIQITPRGNAVFTGEYTTGVKSTVARGLMVMVTTPIDGRKLDKYQRQQPLLVSTFYYFFIQWYVDNYNKICAELSRQLTKFRECIMEIHPRLKQTQFCLQMAYMMFLQFCLDSGFITTSEVRAEYDSFGLQLVDLLRAQNARINPVEQGTEKVNYLKLIRKLYKANDFRLADSTERFDPDKHDGLIYYDCLCLRRESLRKRICKIFRNANINQVVKELKAQGALKLVQDKNVVKINDLPGLWFYAIWLDLLD